MSEPTGNRSANRVMVTPQGDRYLVTCMTELTNPAHRNGPSVTDLYTHDVRARNWVKAKRRSYWGPELSMHVNTEGWTEEAAQSESAKLPAPPAATPEPVHCVWPGCEELTFPDLAARNAHGLETHLVTTLAMIQMPNPDLFKPKPSPKPAAELPLEWAD